MAGLLKWSRTLVWVHLNRRFVASTTEAQAPPGGQRFENIDTINEMAEAASNIRWVECEYEDPATSGEYRTPRYPGHYPTSSFQKGLLAIGSALVSITDVYRADMIACFGEVTGHCGFEYMLGQMKASKEGRRILAQQPRINTQTVDYPALLRMPTNTLGYTYAKFMQDNKISADDRSPVHFVDDPQLAYVAQRYREVHDLFHAMMAMPTTMLGEVTVKWVEAFQTRLPMAGTAGLFGAIRLKPKHRQLYITKYLPWALQTGFESKPFMPVYFEERWTQDIEDLRRELCIPPPPSLFA
ncbi:ubiquinone biosynthesis protein COQ4 homolog, mitochondrial-like [Varroa jacobsoni]|uniref:ubiquinone biosynthesis protein COQ4 homolog, mitochondrial-like n=1 Tax=Varroa jacobsoni TaxID=62625 RepID=UPI000BF685F8|nr:ubiquinone biosynthesis protein COQ4 homolog, mitochondrial-like [Varroa jacobsoni]XP_022706698.1 ubiquinone biosynthesis protein COQ4 homolog, mitochondrial-like [Varroa jacobsoni]